MFRFSSSLILSAVLVFGFTAPSAEAFAVVGRQMVDIDATHTLYLLTFQFGYEKYEVDVPKAVIRGQASSSNSIVYSLLTESNLTVKSGLSVAALVSSASSTATNYTVKTNAPQTFTLAVIHQKTASGTPATLALRHLPFALKSGAEINNTYLHPHEIEPFRVERFGSTTKVTTNTLTQ